MQLVNKYRDLCLSVYIIWNNEYLIYACCRLPFPICFNIIWHLIFKLRTPCLSKSQTMMHGFIFSEDRKCLEKKCLPLPALFHTSCSKFWPNGLIFASPNQMVSLFTTPECHSGAFSQMALCFSQAWLLFFFFFLAASHKC